MTVAASRGKVILVLTYARSVGVVAVLAFLALSSTTPAGASIGVWSSPTTVSTLGVEPLVVTGGGTTTSVWLRFDGSHNRVEAATSTNGGATWSTPTTISVAGNSASEPGLVTDGATITATWVRSDGSDDRVQVASSTDGGLTWSAPANISDTGQNSSAPQLVTDGTTITAVWIRSDGSNDRIETSSSTDSGGTWSAPVTISDAGQSAREPSVVTDGATITVAWARSDGSNYRVQTASSTNDGAAWTTPTTISDPGRSAFAPQLATDGEAITAAWTRSDGSNLRVEAASSVNGGVSWSNPALLSAPIGDARDLRIVTDGTVITAVWVRQQVGDDSLQAASSTNQGDSWSAPTSIANLGANGGLVPRVATDGTTTTAVWSRNDGSNTRIETASSSNGGVSWGTVATLSVAGKNAFLPEVATDGLTITAVWQLDSGTNYIVEASSFTAERAVSRLSGNNRYETSVAISSAFDPNVPVVYLATGTNYPDALSAASAAAVQGGPLLLTTPTSLPTVVRDELVRLDPALVVIAGGTGVVSADVEAAVRLALPSATVRRDAGANRYATSRTIADNAFSASTTTAYIATGANFPDALSASAAAGAAGVPVILVNGTGSGIDSDTQTLLATLGVTSVMIAGGTGVVNSAVENSLIALLGAPNVERFSGANRYDTSVAINVDAFSTADTVFLATGLGFADALSGAALAGNAGAPLYVVPPTCVPPAVLTDLSKLGARYVVLLGGTGVLSASVASLTSC